MLNRDINSNLDIIISKNSLRSFNFTSLQRTLFVQFNFYAKVQTFPDITKTLNNYFSKWINIQLKYSFLREKWIKRMNKYSLLDNWHGEICAEFDQIVKLLNHRENLKKIRENLCERLFSTSIFREFPFYLLLNLSSLSRFCDRSLSAYCSLILSVVYLYQFLSSSL